METKKTIREHFIDVSYFFLTKICLYIFALQWLVFLLMYMLETSKLMKTFL